jgi:hypothetical protein
VQRVEDRDETSVEEIGYRKQQTNGGRKMTRKEHKEYEERMA